MIALLATLWRRPLPWLALAAAILLFILRARRTGETAGRAAERLQNVNERSKLTRLQHLILTRLSDGKAPMRAALI